MQIGILADHWLLFWQVIIFSPMSSNPNWHSKRRTSPFRKPLPSWKPYRGVPGSPQLSLSISVEVGNRGRSKKGGGGGLRRRKRRGLSLAKYFKLLFSPFFNIIYKGPGEEFVSQVGLWRDFMKGTEVRQDRQTHRRTERQTGE